MPRIVPGRNVLVAQLVLGKGGRKGGWDGKEGGRQERRGGRNQIPKLLNVGL